MKIAISTVQAPFVSGGAEFLANNLKASLNKNGHEAEIVTIPFMDSPVELIENHIVAARLLDLTNSWAGKIDLCIGLKFPAYFIPHPNKVNWILHQHRAAYELFNSKYSSLKDDLEGRYVRDIIYNADKRYLSEAKRIYTIAANVSKRLKKYTDVVSQPLYHPCPDMEKFYIGNYEDYILMPSRINITKRQMLALEAMLLSRSSTKLYIVGKADNEYEKNRMLTFIKENKLNQKVKYFDYVTQEEKIKLYADARAVLFIPFDEDYGYITLEAMSAGKALITANDSGAPLEFVENGKNGYVVEPEPSSIADAFDKLGSSNFLSEEMGQKAKVHLKKMNITWENVVKELTKA